MDTNETMGAGAGGREALNAAFWDLGLRFNWDSATWAVLMHIDGLPAQLAYYLEHWQPHLLSAYDPAFLASLVEDRMSTPGTSRMGMEAMSRA